MRLLITGIVALCCSCLVHAQPNITAIVNGADFVPGIAAGGIVTIFGSGLADGPVLAKSIPLPTVLGNTSVQICDPKKTKCSDVSLIFVSPDQINLVLPPSGTGNAVIRVARSANGVIIYSGDFNALVQSYAPRIFSEGHDCLIDSRFKEYGKDCGLSFVAADDRWADRGAVTDLSGRILSSSNLAKLGSYYTIWMTGLGDATNGRALVPVNLIISNVPVYGYSGDTWITVIPSYVGPSPQFPGLYQVNFQLPTTIATGTPTGYPSWPCGTYRWEVSLDIWQGSNEANLVQIPIAVNPGDVACSTAK